MEYIQGTGGFYVKENTAITLGKFDGFHSGHQKLMKRILELENRDCKSVVFKLSSMERDQLLSNEERIRVAGRMGVSYLFECPLVPEVTGMDPEAFVSEVLVKDLHAKYIVVGSDFRFGYQRKGDYKLLQELQGKYGFQVEVMKKKQYYGRDVSSTYIKEELAKGNVETVNNLLGYRFFLMGEVLHGRALSKRLGMPTINLMATTRKLLPPNGVYATKTVIDGERFAGITNIRCSTGDEKMFRGVETYLFDFDRDLYGENIEVQFNKFMRPEKEFTSTEALKAQMCEDVTCGKEYFSE